jgi:adenylate cyclase
MNERTRQRLRSLAAISAMAAAGGAVFGIVTVAQGGAENANYVLAMIRGLYTGLAIATPVATWEIYYVNGPAGSAIRRMSFLANLSIRSLAYLVFILFGLWSGATLFPAGEESAPGLTADFAVQLAFSFVVSVGANFVMSINRLLGQAVFRNFLTGRYHRPVVERRTLLFADLAGSTALAEKIGDLAFHQFLNEVYRDLTGSVVEARGVIHKYVGDEMIVSWAESDHNRRQAIRCGFAMQLSLRQAAGRYAASYGSAPQVRIGIHSGEVVAGEMGEVRQEIVYLGDAMNIAARLVEECRHQERWLMISAPVLQDLDPKSADQELEPMGEIEIRGREGRMNVWAAPQGIEE